MSRHFSSMVIIMHDVELSSVIWRQTSAAHDDERGSTGFSAREGISKRVTMNRRASDVRSGEAM